MNYKSAYFFLFNRITDFIEELQELQIEAEYRCISELDALEELEEDCSSLDSAMENDESPSPPQGPVLLK